MKELVIVAAADLDLQKKVGQVLSANFALQYASTADELAERVRNNFPALIFIEAPRSEELKDTYKKWLVEFRQDSAARKVPIMLLFETVDEKKWLLALSMGVTDFMLKPLNEKELLIRVIGLTRAEFSTSKAFDVLECGNLKMNLASYEVRANGELVTLSVLEFNLLRYLVTNKDRVLAREQVISAVWPNSDVLDRAVDTHVVSLRRKLTAWDYSIVTIYRAGYIVKKEAP